ncbi:hypothetical protein FOXG_06620 [Fusarium oxysporum f. sp. lycopersici 4287]|uniref:Uncharacterized protein n=2 Tax=Fusarium oxysporum TaxID=5507 RepID=A0A0J9V101_FUSO4|nr:hypothetical protein FOXG_06620 [Fusarium oxysporum f. sp. lycopersici 4287]KNB04556.1 hypothetical protein FOXG_06620 [Fusarium oxysporum f. sp. lycopersici 4287]
MKWAGLILVVLKVTPCTSVSAGVMWGQNKEWQGFAAMMAAAYTKDLLRQIPPSKVEAERRVGEVLSSS